MDYFIGDLHNEDKNILMYEHRPFCSTKNMRAEIIKAWNDTVSKKDKVYLLGDIGNPEILKELNGNIIIVLGNHDDYEKIKETAKDMDNITISKYPIMVDGLWLSHEPIGFMPPECPYLNIHAHLHRFNYGFEQRGWNDGNRYFCVSVEQTNYKPISRDEIIKKLGYNEP